MDCDRCTVEADWLVFAAYSSSPEALHPLVAHYPAPMARLCADHLHVAMIDDFRTVGSTREYVVKSIDR